MKLACIVGQIMIIAAQGYPEVQRKVIFNNFCVFNHSCIYADDNFAGNAKSQNQWELC